MDHGGFAIAALTMKLPAPGKPDDAAVTGGFLAKLRQLGSQLMDYLGIDLDAFGQLGFVRAQSPVGVLEVGYLGADGLERCGDSVAGGAAAFELGFQVGVLVGEDLAFHSGFGG